MEHRNITFDLHATPEVEIKADTAKGQFEGYAAMFGNVDHHDDVIESGAFTKTLRERMPKGLIKVFDNHQWGIGVPLTIREDSEGLYTHSQVSDTQRGRDVLTLIRDGVYKHMSIGFRITEKPGWTEDGDRVIRHIREVELYEYSPVFFPANEQTGITSVKGLEALCDRLPAIVDVMVHRGLSADETDIVKRFVTTFEDVTRSLRAVADSTTPKSGPAEPTVLDLGDEEQKALIELSDQVKDFRLSLLGDSVRRISDQVRAHHNTEKN